VEHRKIYDKKYIIYVLGKGDVGNRQRPKRR
jgi:hypothetical protein